MKNPHEIVRGFIDKSLEAARFDHQAHLVVGLWYAQWYPSEQATQLLRQNIKAFNVAKGGENTDTSGYHETITVFYVWAIEQFLSSTNKDLPLEELANQLLASPIVHKEYPLKYYSKERLFSVKARHQWVEPDLQPINEDTFRKNF